MCKLIEFVQNPGPMTTKGMKIGKVGIASILLAAAGLLLWSCDPHFWRAVAFLFIFSHSIFCLRKEISLKQ